MNALQVLCVDDEEGMRLGVERVLRGFRVRVPEADAECGFEIALAETGEQALEMMRDRRPDILLLDHKLPGLSGLEVLERVGAGGEGMLTIMITAYASLETAVTAIKRGAYDFLAKPFTPNELKAVVRKAAEALLVARRARQLAEEKRRVRFEFVSVLSHELKAPLNAVEGYLHLLRDGTLGDDRRAYAQVIERSLARLEGMRKLVADLLDLTRIESGQRPRQVARVDLVALVRAAVETAQPEAQKRGIAMAIEAPDAVAMDADPSEVEIILNNLLSNAVKYNRDGGRVEVAVEADDQTVSLRVRDTGIGMTAEEAARLFRDFVRIRNAKTRHILGSGLGLSIVKKLVNLYDGEVSVSSEPDVGSTFVATLRRFAKKPPS